MRLGIAVEVNTCEIPDAIVGRLPRDLRNALPERSLIAQLIDQPGTLRRLGQIAPGRFRRACRIGDIGGQLGARAGLGDFLLPVLPQRIGQRLIGLSRFGRLFRADEGLDKALVRPHAIDMGIDAKLVDQALIIEPRSAAPQYRYAAQRIDPCLAGMGGKLITVVAIDGGVGKDRLFGSANRVQCLAHAGKRDLTAAHKAVEVQHHCLHLAVRLRRLQSGDDVGQAIFLRLWPRRRQQGEGVRLCRLLDEGPVQLQQQRAAAHAPRGLGRPGKGSIEQSEKAEQE